MRYFGMIYKAINKVNGKIYIGQTIKSLAKRRAAHFNEAKENKSRSIFCRALNKYGRDNFIWQKLCDCNSREEIDYLENFYIKLYESNNLDKGYNLIVGRGRSGYALSGCTKKKISYKAKERLRNKENNPMYGKKHSKKTKELISNELRGKFAGEKNPFYGKKHSANSRKNMSISRTGKRNHLYGKSLTEEHKKKISDSNKGKIFSNKHRMRISESKKGKNLGCNNKTSKKYIVSYSSGEEIMVHGLSNFCRVEGLNQAHMSSCAAGSRNIHKGYKCRYYNKDTDSNIPVWEDRAG